MHRLSFQCVSFAIKHRTEGTDRIQTKEKRTCLKPGHARGACLDFVCGDVLCLSDEGVVLGQEQHAVALLCVDAQQVSLQSKERERGHNANDCQHRFVHTSVMHL